MLAQKAEAAVITTTTPDANIINNSIKHTAESTGKLKEKLAEEIAGLLLFLQDPSLSQDQQTRCWALFESKLRRYVRSSEKGLPDFGCVA